MGSEPRTGEGMHGLAVRMLHATTDAVRRYYYNSIKGGGGVILEA